VLRISLSCKVFLDHPQNYQVCWRGSRLSLVRFSNKQNIHKTKNKNKSKKTRVRETRLDWFWEWSKVSRCNKKNQKKTKNYTKSNRRSNLDHLFPGNGARKRGLLIVYIRIKVQLDLQANKSSVVFKGPFFPQVWTQGIETVEQMCDAKINLIKPRTLIFKGESYASNLESITKTNLIYENRR
jgi:hypothetical protein